MASARRAFSSFSLATMSGSYFSRIARSFS